MKLVLAEPHLLQDPISIISDLVTEARFEVKENGLELTAMDPANVAMVIFKLLSSSFVEYDTEGAETLGLNLNDLEQVLKRSGSGDTITLELDGEQLKVTMKGAATRTFHLPLLNMEGEKKDIPDLSFDAKIECRSDVIDQGVEDAAIVAESVAFTASNDTFTIAATGDLSQANLEIPAGDDTTVDVDDEQTAKYSIEYLKKMISGGKIADDVTVQFSTDYPMRLEYVEKNKVQLGFILAPRVENE